MAAQSTKTATSNPLAAYLAKVPIPKLFQPYAPRLYGERSHLWFSLVVDGFISQAGWYTFAGMIGFLND